MREATWGREPPSFMDVKKCLEELAEKSERNERNILKRLLIRLAPLFELPIFSGRTRIPFDRILEEGATLFLRGLPSDEVKVAVAEFFLRHLWHYMSQLGEYGGLRLYVVIDEAHRLAYEGSPVALMLREGRKFGVGVILSSQQPDDFESKELVFQNATTQLVLRCTAKKHAKAMAEQLGDEKLTKQIRS